MNTLTMMPIYAIPLQNGASSGNAHSAAARQDTKAQPGSMQADGNPLLERGMLVRAAAQRLLRRTF